MATVLVLTAVIFGTEVWVERRIAVDSYIEPVGQKKKKVAPYLTCHPSGVSASACVGAPQARLMS